MTNKPSSIAKKQAIGNGVMVLAINNMLFDSKQSTLKLKFIRQMQVCWLDGFRSYDSRRWWLYWKAIPARERFHLAIVSSATSP
jgi:hypothetical protein